MRLLIVSHFFYPSIGGSETVALFLAKEFAKVGYRVNVITQTLDPEDRAHGFPFEIYRKPSAFTLLRLVADSQVVIHSNISLAMAWPFLLIRCPWVIVQHTWIQTESGWQGMKNAIKRTVLRAGCVIAVSKAMLRHLGCRAEVIYNPYQNEVFHENYDVIRGAGYVYVGRLTAEKGVDILLRAYVKFKYRLLEIAPLAKIPRLSIVGSGPDAASLMDLARSLGISCCVDFRGAISGSALAAILNGHYALVIPTRCNETFGIVALEAIACGCVVIGGSGGGLPEAIGSCGYTFPNGDVGGLADVMLKCSMGRARSPIGDRYKHLSSFVPGVIFNQYLRVVKCVSGEEEKEVV